MVILIIFSSYPLTAFKQSDVVVVAFGHFLPVDTRYHSRIFADVGFRDRKKLTEAMVVLLSDLSGHLKVLLLILADRHKSCFVEQNVCSHQDRVEHPPGVDLLILRPGVFERMRSLKQTKRETGRRAPSSTHRQRPHLIA